MKFYISGDGKHFFSMTCIQKHRHTMLRIFITINAPLILKFRNIIFLSRAKHIMGHFVGFSRARKRERERERARERARA
jgi:hypothetical protein